MFCGNLSLRFLLITKQSRHKIIIEQCDRITNHENVFNSTCDIRRDPGTNTFVNISSCLHPNTSLNSLYVRMKFILKHSIKWLNGFCIFNQLKLSVWRKENGVFKIFMGINNLTIDICAYLNSGGVAGMMFDILFKNIKQHSNLFDYRCPIRVRAYTEVINFVLYNCLFH